MSGLTLAVLYRTDETSRLRDRALLYFGDPHITPYPDTKPIVWAFDINVANAGNMPARRVAIRFDCPRAPSSDDVRDTFQLAKELKSAAIASVIGPKQEVRLQACEVPIEVIAQAQNFQLNILYLVEAKYLDGFDAETTRVTQMSRGLSFDTSGGRSWSFTNSHNCTDDDCPE